MVTVREQVKALRAETGLSQRAFAEKLGIPRRTVENWESGTNTPPPYVIAMMTKIIELEH